MKSFHETHRTVSDCQVQEPFKSSQRNPSYEAEYQMSRSPILAFMSPENIQNAKKKEEEKKTLNAEYAPTQGE
jgi:hypothetical protein